MSKQPRMDDTTVFEGFPSDAHAFFADLTTNNNKAWFDDAKARYQASVLIPTARFIAEFGAAAQLIDPALQFDAATNGRGSMFRIYRDVRFSKDKRPYKTNLGMLFWMGGYPKKKDNPGLYFHLDAETARLHGGLYGFGQPQQTAFRKAVADAANAEKLSTILATLSQAGWEIKGERNKRLPKGLDAESQTGMDLLHYKGLFASAPPFRAADIQSPELVSAAFEHAKTVMPLVRWLADHVAIPLEDPRERKDH